MDKVKNPKLGKETRLFSFSSRSCDGRSVGFTRRGVSRTYRDGVLVRGFAAALGLKRLPLERTA